MLIDTGGASWVEREGRRASLAPAYRILTTGVVRRVGRDAQDAVLPSVVTQDPEPLASAAWQITAALEKLGDLMEAGRQSGPAMQAGEDVAYRLQDALALVHRHLGRTVPAEALGERTFGRQVDKVGSGEALIGAVTIEVLLDDGDGGPESATVLLGQQDRDRTITVRADGLDVDLDGAAHLDVQAALDRLARALQPVLDPPEVGRHL
ncbi:hypothetical protein [Kitasatospora griseola]|uniref:hypothetical protein n=1 Tax=Kitasatospora griseola TaxID=2064 RepID=UPI0037F2E1B6